MRKAEDFGKEIIVVLLNDVAFDDRRLDPYKDRQILQLAAEPQAHSETVTYSGESYDVRFNADALAKIKDYLIKRGIAPEHFAWPPRDKPNAEPFPGLAAFTEEEAGIFFGRDADIVRGLDKLRIVRRNRRPRLLVIQAASGAGKSSFLRAGLWPRLKRDPDFAPLAILRPAQGILTGPDGLGQTLAALLTRPAAPVAPGDIHAALAADDQAKAAAALLDLITSATRQAHEARRIGDRGPRPPALVLAVDQAEELFAAEDAAESGRFLSLLAGLLRDAADTLELFVLATIRADSADRLLQALAAQGSDVPETLPLLPLPATSYRDVILKPIEVLARRGQRIVVEPALADRLAADAAGADALPLLAFTLARLYRDFNASGSLTLAQYDTMGGIGGSIDKALKEALAGAGADGEGQLRRLIIPHLATWDRDADAAKRLVARPSVVTGGERAALAPLAGRLVEARLLTRGAAGSEPALEVAHEALLRREPVAAWLREDREFLIFRDEAERAERRWQEMGRADRALLAGLDLARAEEWLPKRPQDLSAEVRAFTQASIARDRAEKERRLRLQRRVSAGAVVAALIMAAVGVFAWVQWGQANDQRVNAEAQTQRAEAETRRAEAETKRAEAALIQAEDEKARGDEELKNAQIAQSRILAGLALKALEDKDHTRAALLLLDALPGRDSPRPLVKGLPALLYDALAGMREIAILKGHAGLVVGAAFMQFTGEQVPLIAVGIVHRRSWTGWRGLERRARTPWDC